MTAAQRMKARLAAKRQSVTQEMRPFSEVQQQIETQFVDLELKTLTIMTFDFDYDFSTPIVFIKMFLNSHYDQMGFNDPKEFGKFDKKICEITLEKVYGSGEDLCLFWPPEIIAAGMIFEANE